MDLPQSAAAARSSPSQSPACRNSSAAVRYSPVRSYQLPSRPQASLRALRQKGEFPAQQLPQHMVAAVDAGAAFDDERVVVRQIVQQRVRVRRLPDDSCLICCKVLGLAVFQHE